MNNEVKCKSLFSFNSVFFTKLFEGYEYPWEILPHIKEIIAQLIRDGIPGYQLLRDGVLVGEGVRISESAHIDAPCIIGRDTEIRQGAYIRGSVIIGDGCVIGNSSEVKGSVIMDKAQVPHFNYVGDSILGEGAHLGAGAICSNLRSDKQTVTVRIKDVKIKTGLRKLGAILGDGVEIGCGAVLCPGSVIGRGTTVYPTALVRGFYPGNSIVKRDGTVIAKNTES